MGRIGLAWLALMVFPAAVLAQGAWQQPVVSQFSARTAVSVPDRGAIQIGSVSSTTQLRSSYGPLRQGTAAASAVRGGGLSAHVFIHDMAAMDAELLAQPVPTGQFRHTAVPERSMPARPRFAPTTATTNTVSSAVEVAAEREATARRFEELARSALARGKPGVARLHWQMAAKYGSSAADEWLTQAAATPRPTP